MRLLPAFLVASCAPAIPTVATRSADTATPQPALTVLHVLTEADGVAVRGALTSLGGRLYGPAGERGPNGTPNCSGGAAWQTIEHTAHCPGSLFSLREDGSDFRVEHAFTRLDDVTGQNQDGYHPYGSLAAGPDGCLYGVTQAGGVAMGGAPGDPPAGFGLAFRCCPGGDYKVLHMFGAESRAADGEYPMGAVAVDPEGNVYGTTKGGGATSTGTVWKWSPDGSFRFAPLPSGETYGGLALSGTTLHGTSWEWTSTDAGIYYTIDTVTLQVQVAGRFPLFPWPQHGNDNTPIQEPTVLTNGQVIVPREFGGAYGAGLIAELSLSSGIRVLREAQDIRADVSPRFSNTTGAMFNGRIVEGRDGLLYGTCQYGGAYGTGCIYQIARDGTRFRVLYSFPDAAYPYGGLTVGSDGALYGTAFDTGRIFRFVPQGSCQ